MTEAEHRAVAVTEEIRTAAVQARKRDGYFWLVMVATAVGSAGIAMLFSAHNTNETELKFCALVDTSVSQARERTQGFQQAPPTTAAGREQQRQAANSVVILTDLQRSLGCPIDQGAVQP